jgi:hypothetical protein
MKIYLCSSAAPRAFHLTSGSAAACARNKTQHSPIAERIHHSESILIYIYTIYIHIYFENYYWLVLLMLVFRFFVSSVNQCPPWALQDSLPWAELGCSSSDLPPGSPRLLNWLGMTLQVGGHHNGPLACDRRSRKCMATRRSRDMPVIGSIGVSECTHRNCQFSDSLMMFNEENMKSTDKCEFRKTSI